LAGPGGEDGPGGLVPEAVGRADAENEELTGKDGPVGFGGDQVIDAGVGRAHAADGRERAGGANEWAAVFKPWHGAVGEAGAGEEEGFADGHGDPRGWDGADAAADGEGAGGFADVGGLEGVAGGRADGGGQGDGGPGGDRGFGDGPGRRGRGGLSDRGGREEDGGGKQERGGAGRARGNVGDYLQKDLMRAESRAGRRADGGGSWRGLRRGA